MEDLLRQHVHAAALRVDVRKAVARVYADLQQEVDSRRPICSASGKCCRFEEYGHRLYVSTLELAAFVAELPDGAPDAPDAPDATTALPVLTTGGSDTARASCPFQVHNHCSVHAIRPFGCRMFFCDPTSTAWQNERYERFHGELKRLHEELNVPYLYVEWRQALAALGLMPEREPAERRLSRT